MLPAQQASAAVMEPETPRLINGVSAEELTDHAYEILVRSLEGFGNKLTTAHKQALREILSTYSSIAFGSSSGRYAVPLGTGMGKTQSIIAFVTALNDLGLDVSLAVCASQVEALCDLKRALIRNGVPEEHIELWHSYPYDPAKAQEYMEGDRPDLKGFASLPATDIHQAKQILLVTHNRLRGKGSVNIYNTYMGKPRNLIIWDESLFVSDSTAVELWNLKSAASGLTYVPGDDRKLLMECLTQWIDMLHQEEAAQQDGEEPKVVHLPRLTNSELDALRKAVPASFWNEEIKGFIDICQYPLRVYRGQQSSLITYEMVVDPCLTNMVILDASHSIRKLCNLNHDIKQLWGSKKQCLVSYEDVTIHQLVCPSGRTSVEKYTDELGKGDSGVQKEVVLVIKNAPRSEAILIFTFKRHPGGHDHIKALRRSLQKNGIDPDEMITVEEEGRQVQKRRINFLTWGNECSLNRFSYCTTVILAGILHRNPHELASRVAGECKDLTVNVPWKEIQEIQTSEICHCIYQALSRGSCRVIRNGKAGTMDAWLIHGSLDIRETINDVMPHVHWVDWKPRLLVSKTKTKMLVSRIVQYLTKLSPGVSEVSTQQVKKDLGIEPPQKNTFTRAVKEAAETAGWILVDRSLVRTAALFKNETCRETSPLN